MNKNYLWLKLNLKFNNIPWFEYYIYIFVLYLLFHNKQKKQMLNFFNKIISDLFYFLLKICLQR